MEKNSEREYRIAVGRSRTETAWLNKSVTWSTLVGRLKHCKRTPESVAEYRSMSRPQKGAVKDIGGFVGGELEEGRRKADSVVVRSLVTLDIDYGQTDTPDVIADTLYDVAWVLYSTHSHTPEAPRFRLVIPLSRDVTPEEYIPIARRLADTIDIDVFDGSTYEPCRLMYWPSCPRDGEYVYRVSKVTTPVDADAILASYGDWRNITEWPIDRRTTRIAQGRGAKQEDPTTKGGIIGVFCRAYTISEAISTFLPDVYSPTAHEDRYTFIGGTSACGLVVYDDKYAYSHHGTDPCCEKLCNAFDLVRLHKFGAEDIDADINTPTAKLPSFIAMERFAREDPKCSALATREHLKELNDDFKDLPEEDTKWADELVTDKRGAVVPSPFNLGLIIRNDPGLKDTVKRDLFRGRDVIVRDLPWRRAAFDPYWINSDDNGLIEYISGHYGLVGKTTIIDALDIAVSQNFFHPVRDYLNALEWDGQERLDTLLIDYLGADDSELIRAMTRKHFTAAVARVMSPGVKYDYVLTFIGKEGLGKSTLIRTMGKGEWYNESLTSIEGKDGMEQLRGKWLVEFGELTGYKKSTSEAYKAFISKQEDSYRPAYGRKTEVYPRQCVFFASTNENTFLKGDTGNRRFWTVMCGLAPAKKDVWNGLPDEVDQIWAEAVVRWRQHEQLWLSHELEAEARALQEEFNEVQGDDRIGLIEAFVRKELPSTWESMTIKQRQDWFRLSSETDPDEPRIRRESISAVEILVECFGQQPDEKTRYRTKEINQILRNMPDLEYLGRAYDKAYGQQRRFKILWEEQL